MNLFSKKKRTFLLLGEHIFPKRIRTETNTQIVIFFAKIFIKPNKCKILTHQANDTTIRHVEVDKFPSGNYSSSFIQPFGLYTVISKHVEASTVFYAMGCRELVFG